MRQMKFILRIGTALFMACLLACVCSIAAFAVGTNGADAGTTVLHTFIVPGKYSKDGKALTVHVAINGTATDGLLTVSYDPEVLSITSDDITVTELTDMHSVNVVRPGTLKISFIAGDTHDAGDVAVLDFTVLDLNAETELVLSADVYDEDENMLGEGDLKLYTEDQPSTPTGSPSPSTSTSAESEPQQTSAQETADGSGDASNGDGQASGSENNDKDDLTPDTGNAGPVALGIVTIVSLSGMAVCTVAYRRSKH